jgi:adenosylcobinamide-GDP ribazoletransferase
MRSPWLASEVQAILAAVMFFTRIPVPAWTKYSHERLQRSARYLPLIGILIGGISALVFVGASFLLPVSVSVMLALAAGIWLTGGFHEDGLADFADGFGGGYTREKTLEIMKDSRIGSYGALALILALALKATTLTEMPPSLIPWCFVAAHSMSRFLAVSFMHTHSYARSEDTSAKSAPFAPSLTRRDVWIASAFGIVPLIALPIGLLSTLLPLLILRTWFARLLTRRLQGYTGDCLGAVQQIGEVLFYVSVLALVWKSF